MDYYKRSLELKEETVSHRRWLHLNAETGLNMPLAVGYIKKVLASCGIQAADCGHGVSAVIGEGGKCILLRADMDALPMREESGESFACPSGSAAHTCGHDLHAAMLLTAAKMLKESEAGLKGRVKLMFQPAEESFEGSRDMIESGVLKTPTVDAALAFHVAAGKTPPGFFMYNSDSVVMNSVDSFHIHIYGKGGHGAYPQLTVDPIRIAVRLYETFESLIAREADPGKSCVLTIGKLQSGSAANIIPSDAVMEGTLRTNDASSRELLVRRLQELTELVPKSCGGHAELSFLSQVPPLACDKALTDTMASYLSSMPGSKLQGYPGITASASEDFAVIAEKVPSAFIYLTAGFDDERGDFPAHNPKVLFNEDVLPIGAAGLAHCAANWLDGQ